MSKSVPDEVHNQIHRIAVYELKRSKLLDKEAGSLYNDIVSDEQLGFEETVKNLKSLVKHLDRLRKLHPAVHWKSVDELEKYLQESSNRQNSIIDVLEQIIADAKKHHEEEVSEELLQAESAVVKLREVLSSYIDSIEDLSGLEKKVV